jgi:alpha-L-fucosidase
MKSRLLPLILSLSVVPASAGGAAARTEWFEDARFGLFIHFGLYSLPAGLWNGQRMGRNDYAEWIRFQHGWPQPGGIPRSEYDTLLAQFNPTEFDADVWVREAKGAGMKYLLITAKHHDGFALWDSQVSAYNVVQATPFKRDILAELTAACRRHGLRVGFYYSHWLDWDHPGGALPPWPEQRGDPPLVQPSQEAYETYWTEKCLPQVQELLVNYSPDFLWFDSWGKATGHFLTDQRLVQLIALVRQTKPDCLINSRIGTRDGVDYLSMGDNSFPKQGFDQPWETSGTLNHSWGYHQLDYRWKPTRQLLRWLVDNASRGGNYQLNVGPTGTGAFQPAAVRRLREIGAWLAVNGPAIHGTRRSEFPEPEWGRLTVARLPEGRTRLHAIVYDPTPGARLLLVGPDRMPTRAYVLETGEPVLVEPAVKGFHFTMPAAVPDDGITVIGFDL